MKKEVRAMIVMVAVMNGQMDIVVSFSDLNPVTRRPGSRLAFHRLMV